VRFTYFVRRATHAVVLHKASSLSRDRQRGGERILKFVYVC